MLQRAVADAISIPCLPYLQVCGEKLKPISLARTKVTYNADTDTFTTLLCKNSAFKLRSVFPDFLVEDLRLALLAAMPPLIMMAGQPAP